MTTVYITRLTEPAGLYHRFQNEDQPQQCYLELDSRDGELSCYYDNHIGNAVDLENVTGLCLRVEIPCLTAEHANALMEQVAGLAQVVVDGFEKKWDGNNHVGVYTPEADAAWQEVRRMVTERTFEDCHRVEAFRDLGEWYLEGARHACNELGVTASTTDAKLAEIARREAENARYSGQAGYTLLDADAVEWFLRREREEMRDEHRDQLGEVAAQLALLGAKRDVLLTEIRSWGDTHRDSLRSLGHRARVSHSEAKRIADAGGERVLYSSSRWGLYEAPRDNAVINRYGSALEKGLRLRLSETDHDDDGADIVEVVAYTDPVDGSMRFAVQDQQSNGQYEVVDYNSKEAAEAQYEALVRSNADVGFLYAKTDVEGVPTRSVEV